MPSKIIVLPSTSVGMTTVGNDIGELLQATLTIPSKEMVSLVRNYIIGRSPLAANELKLFTIKGGIAQDKYAIAMLNRAKHLWSSRKDGCQFVPKGRIGSQRAEFELQPIEYDGVQCPDEFFGSEWETMFATGDPFEMLQTQAGAFALDAIVKIIIDSLHQDFWNLLMYGSHPIITTAETNGTYTVSETEWADFKDQMKNVGGFITTADFLKTSGRDNFNVAIEVADVDGETYIGDVADDLFKRVRDAALPIMRTQMKRRSLGQTLFLVSRGIFNKYKDELIDRFKAIPVAYTLQTTGIDGTKYAMEDVLMWDGNVIVCFDELSEIDTLVGYDTHMVLATVPGNIPILYNANTARGAKNIGSDFGLKIQTSSELEKKGKVYMHANMKVATGLINPDLCVYAVLRQAQTDES
jgi:hypothetical protein